MKKFLSLTIVTVMLLASLCSCNEKAPNNNDGNIDNIDNSIDEIQIIQASSDYGSEQQGDDNLLDVLSVDYSNINNLPQNHLQVIKSEKTFYLMGEEVLIDNYKSPYLQKHLTQCDNVQYAVLDMDGDGKEEVLISGWTSDILVLHEENGNIYGFDFTFRGMYNVKTDGSYYWNTNQGNTYGCSKLSFENGICSVVELNRAEFREDGSSDFFVNGVKVAKGEYDSAIENISVVDNVTWYKLSIFPKNIEDKG